MEQYSYYVLRNASKRYLREDGFQTYTVARAWMGELDEAKERAKKAEAMNDWAFVPTLVKVTVEES